MYCKALKEISFPSSLEKIGINIFNECTCLEEVKVSSNVKAIKLQLKVLDVHLKLKSFIN